MVCLTSPKHILCLSCGLFNKYMIFYVCSKSDHFSIFIQISCVLYLRRVKINSKSCKEFNSTDFGILYELSN